MYGCSKISCDYTTSDPNDAHFDYMNHTAYELSYDHDEVAMIGNNAEQQFIENEPTNTFKCKDCGETCERYRGEYEVLCPKCGATHNAGGQRLRNDWASNPSNYDSEIGDLEGFEIQHAGDF